MGFHPANFGIPVGFSVLELGQGTQQTDGRTDRQTDRHRASFHNTPPYGGQRHNKDYYLIPVESIAVGEIFGVLL